MRHLLQYQITLIKHKIRSYWLEGQRFLDRNAAKLVVILFAFQILWTKDIRLSVDLRSKAETAAPGDMAAAAAQDVAWENGHADPSTPKPAPANTFSNLGFILNPTYAKRKRVPESTVKYHNDKCRKYVQAFAPIAQAEMAAYGVPASIKLAQGLLESNAGDSRLARSNNNHFGIKCFSRKCKKGHCSNFTDDSHKDFFRKYDSAKASYRAHSLFLQKDRYSGLKKLDCDDYKGWAHGLERAGYATDEHYAQKLIRIIEALELHRYDKGC